MPPDRDPLETLVRFCDRGMMPPDRNWIEAAASLTPERVGPWLDSLPPESQRNLVGSYKAFVGDRGIDDYPEHRPVFEAMIEWCKRREHVG